MVSVTAATSTFAVAMVLHRRPEIRGGISRAWRYCIPSRIVILLALIGGLHLEGQTCADAASEGKSLRGHPTH